MLLKSAQPFKVKCSLFCSMTRHTRYWRSGDDSWVEESNGEEAGCGGAAAIHRIGFLRRTFCLQGNGGQDASWPENRKPAVISPCRLHLLVLSIFMQKCYFYPSTELLLV